MMTSYGTVRINGVGKTSRGEINVQNVGAKRNVSPRTLKMFLIIVFVRRVLSSPSRTLAAKNDNVPSDLSLRDARKDDDGKQIDHKFIKPFL